MTYFFFQNYQLTEKLFSDIDLTELLCAIDSRLENLEDIPAIYTRGPRDVQDSVGTPPIATPSPRLPFPTKNEP